MDDARFLLQPYLVGPEILRWTGRPAGGVRFSAGDVLLIPFSIMWGGFAIFWESMVLATDAPGFMAIWGVPFVLAGLYFIAGRFFIDAWARRRTVYGLTDRRALILKRVPGGGLTAVDMANAQSLRLKLAGDGSGAIAFGQPNMFGLFGARSFTGWSPALSSQPAFIALPDAAAVYRQVEQARAALGAAR